MRDAIATAVWQVILKGERKAGGVCRGEAEKLFLGELNGAVLLFTHLESRPRLDDEDGCNSKLIPLDEEL